MKNEILAMAMKGALIADTLGWRSALGYLQKRGFRSAEAFAIVVHGYTTLIDGTQTFLRRR